MEIVIILWILFGVISAIIASGKGNSGCGGFILGVLLGPIGIIIALASSSDEQKEEQSKQRAIQEGEHGQYRKCPYCAEAIKKEATKCRYCHEDVKPVE